MKGVNVISTCRMGPGTFEAKFMPLQKVPQVERIFVVRKTALKRFSKLEFIVLPQVCKNKFLNVLVTPFVLTRNTLKTKSDLILAYHIIPHGFFAYFSSKLTGKPYVLGQTGIYVQRFVKKKIVGRFIKHIIEKATYLNVPGTESKNFWIKEGIPSDKINVLHSTIDTDHFINTNEERTYDFIFVGRLAKEKQVDVIISAISILHERGEKVSMVIVGDGPLMESMKELALSLHVEQYITFVGFQPNVAHWLNKAKVFVMASLSEGLPTAMMQAMSCELVCVSSDVGNIPDMLVHGKNGYLFSLDETPLLPNTLSEALSSFSNKELSQLARETVVKNHSYIEAIKKWSDLFQSLK